MNSQPSLRGIQVSIFFVSAVLISYEILLIKMFSIQYWHHFAYLIISVALLGFGASGTFIFLFRRTLKNKTSTIFYVFPLLLFSSIWINVYLGRVITFNPLMIIWQISEILNLIYVILAMFVPFFLGAVCIGLGFLAFPGNVHKIYFSNLLGSGLGPLLTLLTVLHLSIHEIIFIVSLMSIVASFSSAKNRLRKSVSLIILIAAFPLYLIFLHDTPVEMNPFKDLSRAESLKKAKKEFQEFGPLGLVTVIDSPAYHYLPDLSLNCPYTLPEQKGLFLDGNTVGAINRFSGKPEELRFMEYRTNSLAYHLLTNPEVLIIGGGGGTEILGAKYYRAKNVSVVEMNGEIISLMQDRYRRFSGDIYNPDECQIFIEDGRGYLQRTKEKFDLIQLSVSQSMDSASSGVYSLSENYLLTREALRTCLDRLNPGGVISISRWVKDPPRESMKLLAMAIDALESKKKDASGSIIMIRSWQTATLLIKNGIFSPEEIEKTKDFCHDRIFDLCYYSGITNDETNVVNRMSESYFFVAAKKLLSKEKEQFYQEYPFDIRPATDNKPFFSHFFKTGILKKYLSSEGRSVIPFMDWGYILVWISFLILVLLSIIFILVPLRLMGQSSRGTLPVFVYFGSLGLAYMFLEISFLQQFIRYLYDPVFSATVVISSFLVYSGIGSLIGDKIRQAGPRHISIFIIFIVVMGGFYLAADPFLQRALSGLSLWIRMLICSLLIAPLAVPMGIPFPSGLSKLRHAQKDLIPWAWGVNGFFSVIGTSGAVLIAIGLGGFKVVILFALTLYILSGITYILVGSTNLNS